MRAVTWPLAPVLCVAQLAVHHGRLIAGPSDVLYLVAMLVCWAVGVFLTWSVVDQPAGWAFLGLGTALTWSGFTDVYVASTPGPDHAALIATFSDSSFVWWFVFLALGLQFTPAVRPSSRALPILTVVSGVVFQIAALLRSTPLEPPYDGIVSPWAIAGSLMKVLAFIAVIVLGLCLLASVYVLAAAFRRARGEARQQLLWLVAGATPIAPIVIASFVASYAGFDDLAGWVLSICVITLALGAALSVAKYRLYDVERIVIDSTAYAISTGAVLAVFALVVVVITKSLPVRADSQLLTILATLAAIGVARPAYLWARRVVDRRFNRRRFDAVQVVRAGLAQSPAPELGALLIEATGDPRVRALFRSDGGWVTADGRAAVPSSDVVDVVRRGQVSALVEFDPARSERTVVEALVQEAAAEIDNLGLRAELAKQVEQITESRARLAGAHLEERRRMERDLHDGAQQRILAIALQLRSARVNGAEAVLRAEVDQAITDLALTMQELRDLASGLQPAALAGGGLRAATDELASRIPVRMKLDVIDQRFSASVESAAWFVIAEAVSNAVKHAGVDEVTIRVSADQAELHVAVLDEGLGGVDPRGRGLQGLADRVAALGGVLSACSQPGGGTRVEAVLPCG
ncbi:signal transduction histidine kinase [Kribbella kalugense]|uniref:histidine kinase n=1 Tax=Kribbella kalugense TaxID=2512221 RepID=A0A4R7ZV80_9ACTN|nr:signal transduction histidine kinase [Kribbella kalugense]